MGYTVSCYRLLQGKDDSQLHHTHDTCRYASHLYIFALSLWCDYFSSKKKDIDGRSDSTFHSLLVPVMCHSSGHFHFLPWLPDYIGVVWLGGRESVPDPDTDSNDWIWDHSGDPIVWALWRDGQPSGDNTEDHAFINTERDGLDDLRGSSPRYFLCETASSNLTC